MFSLRESLVALIAGAGVVGASACVTDGYHGRYHDGRYYHGKGLYHDRDHRCDSRRDSDCYRDRRHRYDRRDRDRRRR